MVRKDDSPVQTGEGSRRLRLSRLCEDLTRFMSDTNYNPADKGKAFNEDTPTRFDDITTQDKLNALTELDKLVEDTRANLGE